MKSVLENSIEDMCIELFFCVETNDFGEDKQIELIPGGSSIAVTDENKFEYARLVAHYRMTTSIKEQITAFLDGFYAVIPPELISLFDAQELELLISGLPYYLIIINTLYRTYI